MTTCVYGTGPMKGECPTKKEYRPCGAAAVVQIRITYGGATAGTWDGLCQEHLAAVRAERERNGDDAAGFRLHVEPVEIEEVPAAK